MREKLSGKARGRANFLQLAGRSGKQRKKIPLGKIPKIGVTG